MTKISFFFKIITMWAWKQPSKFNENVTVQLKKKKIAKRNVMNLLIDKPKIDILFINNISNKIIYKHRKHVEKYQRSL